MNPQPLKRYERSSQCPKCGSQDASTQFGDYTESVKPLVKYEVMKRICRVCEHVRYELPLDATEAESQIARTLRGSVAATARGNGPAPLHRNPEATPAPPAVRK